MPRWLPLHPGRFWNHARMVYLPLSYLYGRRVTGAGSPVLDASREEIFGQGGVPVDRRKAAFLAGKTEVYVPLSRIYRGICRVLFAYEARPVDSWRRKALDFVYDQVRQEDENTHFICVGPVSKMFNLMARHDREPGSTAMEAHWRELETYLCRDEEGISIHGYNHSRLWDTAFALQAIEAAADRLGEDRVQTSWMKGRSYVLSQQVWEETPERSAFSGTGPGEDGRFRMPSTAGPSATAPRKD